MAVSDESLKNHPKIWKWRLEWLAQTGLEKLAGILPGRLVFRLGELLGGFAWHFMKERRQIVLRNLRIAFYGEHDVPALRRLARESFRRTGANLLSALHTSALTAERVGEILITKNQEIVEKSLSGSPGLVLMPSHMGNWEILSRMNRMFPQGHKIGAFYRPLNNPLLNDRVVAQRAIDGTRLFSKNDSLHNVTGFLREGSLIGILADQRVGMQGEAVRFFGRLTRASPLPSLMARRSRSEVLTMSLITDSPGRWHVFYHPVNRPFKTADCMESLEIAMKASPVDVFWLQERWKVYVNTKRTIREWLGTDLCGEGKPHRALLWLSGAPADWQLPEDWTHPDVIYEIVLSPGQSRPSWSTGQEVFHTAPVTDDRKEMAKVLAGIDAAHGLPVDYILTAGASKALKKASDAESIPLVSLPHPS
jgi:KDO2-lipid IV(A) lauroyltransferase